jgi:hypothetical protein
MQANSRSQKDVVVRDDGTIICGSKRYKSDTNTIRRQIIHLISRNNRGHLAKDDYERELIASYIGHLPSTKLRLISEPYLRRQNNVDKALSRLRRDLAKFFKDELPDGTSWICFSKKINGWLLYRLPGLGCDGDYHW